MTIGIIGAGKIGLAHARHFAKAGYRVVLSNSRGPDSLSGLIAGLGGGARAGTVSEAAAASVVVVSVPWLGLREALTGLPPWGDRIVIDTTNPIIPPGFSIADLHGKTSSEIFAGLVPGARVVKAGNTLPAAVLASDPAEGGGRRVLFLSGDDANAKKTYGDILAQAGFAVVDLGGLVAGGRMQQVPTGPFAGLNFIQLL